MLNEIADERIELGLVTGIDGGDVDAGRQGVHSAFAQTIFADVHVHLIDNLVNAAVDFGLRKKDAEETADNGTDEFGVAVATDLLKRLDDVGKVRNAAELVRSSIGGDLQDVAQPGLLAENFDALQFIKIIPAKEVAMIRPKFKFGFDVPRPGVRLITS